MGGGLLLNLILGGGCSCLFPLTVVGAYFAFMAHHTHNKPPSTMLATTAVILTTIHNMNNSYNICIYFPLVPALCRPRNHRKFRSDNYRSKDRGAFRFGHFKPPLTTSLFYHRGGQDEKKTAPCDFLLNPLTIVSLRGSPCPSRLASSSPFMRIVPPATTQVHARANDLLSTYSHCSVYYPATSKLSTTDSRFL